MSDRKVFVYKEYPNWVIKEQTYRGYEPFYTLHKKKSFLGYEYLGGMYKCSSELKKLYAFVLRWEGWK